MEYTTVEQQLQRLKDEHLIIENKQFAINSLLVYGYSDIIKSYREPYSIIEDGHKVFRSDIYFEQVFSLFLLDKTLRNGVFSSLIDFEEHLKAVVADIIGASFGIDPDDYLEFRRYRDVRKRNRHFSLSRTLQNLRNGLSSDKDPIAHYREQHGIVPPWILFKSAYFSTIVNLVNFLPNDLQDQIVYRMIDPAYLSDDATKNRCLLRDCLALCLDYRNLAAHGGRTYNYVSPCIIRNHEDMTGFSALMFALNIFIYKSPVQTLHDTLHNSLLRHCSIYPADVTFLSSILNMDIQMHAYVWHLPKSSVYHFDSHCSGMKNAIRVEFTDAIINNYTPCKKCCPIIYK